MVMSGYFQDCGCRFCRVFPRSGWSLFATSPRWSVDAVAACLCNDDSICITPKIPAPFDIMCLELCMQLNFREFARLSHARARPFFPHWNIFAMKCFHLHDTSSTRQHSALSFRSLSSRRAKGCTKQKTLPHTAHILEPTRHVSMRILLFIAAQRISSPCTR
ncbi:hypothetical protein BV25DRAFT_1241713 [Artomyces pyxidatus]|uniref:Uncharacterized protein n=1 Tax=Artomyces pyxidatus TaxID=48021 RepID=A0ACB8TEC9_9AGAM|nr:hypothetical protein BV25DRAFT_1241713 [Artomyces pyxidatus]